MKINVNPQAQASGDFGYVEAGEYSLRCTKVEQLQKSGSAYPYLKWTFEFADPNVSTVEKNADGSNKKAGNIFENTSLKPDAQFGLRDICEALGLTWGDFDTDNVRGLEARAKVNIDAYEGKLSNKVAKWVKR